MFSDKKLINTATASADLSPINILSEIEAEYNSLINTDEWPPAKNKVDPTAPPSQKFGASVLTTANTSLRPNGNHQFIKSKFNNGTSKKFKKNNKRNFKPSQSWKFKAPKPGEPQEIIKKNVK